MDESPDRSSSTNHEGLISQIENLRASYEQRRTRTNLYPPAGAPIHDLKIDTVHRYSFWFEDGSKIRHLRIYDVPGSLSGDILRLKADLPVIVGDCEIEGNVIRPLLKAPPPPEAPEDDTEDVSSMLDRLPLVNGLDKSYFLKKPKYASEIENLLKCQGGSCPGNPSPYIVQLLGKDDRGQLVFPKHSTRTHVTAQIRPAAVYKRWFRQLVMGVQALHSLGIVHRDLRAANLIFTQDTEDLVICDLESKWGNRAAPEMLHNRTTEAGWSEASDIWDIGDCIKYVMYGNAPINDVIEWPVPSPFAEIVEACQRPIPRERASLTELIDMLDSI